MVGRVHRQAKVCVRSKSNIKRAAVLLAALLINQGIASAAELKGTIQAAIIHSDDTTSFINDGTGVLRHDNENIELTQSIFQITHDFGSGIDFKAVGNYYDDGEHHLGWTQAFFNYKPLVAGNYKFKARAGFFYPEFSFENVDLGWLSPYTYTQSAINSWVGEELRTPGAEISLFSPGRARKSPWSWQLTLAAYKGNDPLGTMLAWRGWAMHDRQSLHTDRVEFAPYPSVVDRINHPSWVEPFHEIDGKLGYYLGGHLDYYKKSRLRYYFYDNKGDPSKVNSQRLYAWRTKFHSFAWQHNFSKETRLISQWMSGSSEMGPARWVYIDFDSWYVMLSHRMGAHRISARYDDFTVGEDDIWPWDYNDSDGQAFTIAWRYNLDKQWQLGAELLWNDNRSTIRRAVGVEESVNQQQSKAVVQYKF